VWTRPVSEVIGIKKILNEIPDRFSLHQNYPNPFNPTTKIRFDISSLNKGLQPLVQLKVYDALGKEAGTIVNEQLKPGIYEVQWDASNYPSGVYFYQLSVDPSDRSQRSDGYVQTKKMILLK
jgi:hypothetical protein